MSENEKHINSFPTETLQQYVQGRLTDEERHAVEKAALEDPFLAEALEGMEMQQLKNKDHSLVEDVSALKKKLRERTASNRKIVWWQVAASVALLLGAGSFAYVYMSGHGKQTLETIAVKKSVAMPKSDSAEIGPAPLTNADAPKAEPHRSTVNSPKQSVKKDIPLEMTQAVASDSVSYTDKLRVARLRKLKMPDSISLSAAPTSSFNVDQPSRGKSAGTRVEAFSTFEKNYVQGIVTDSNNRPLAGASVLISHKNISTLTDQNGRFQLNAGNPDSLVKVDVQALGYQPATTVLNSRAPFANQVQLKASTTALNDVVVIGYGSRKKERADEEDLAAAANEKKEEMSINAKAAPVTGWAEYNSYLNQHKKILTSDSTLLGYEIVSFLVDQKGLISSFRIEQSISPAHDKEAIRLIREGPPWKLRRGKKQRCRVIITF